MARLSEEDLHQLLIGAIEAGGTKINCGIGDEAGNLHDYVTLPTRTPTDTLKAVLDYFHDYTLDGLGIASFGPIEVNPVGSQYGKITSTPKLAWQNFNWLETMQEKVKCPVVIDTDVNAAALGEARWGGAKGLANCVYITVGTGIGAGLLVEGNLVHGLLHPEVGHILIRRHANDSFGGSCPFHTDCLEGMASGPAIAARWGTRPESLGFPHPAWDFEAFYLAQAIVTLILTTSTQRIILGGGVLHQSHLIEKVREQVLELLAGYVAKDEVLHHMDEYIILPELGDFAGLKGALALVMRNR